ncbi:MAG: TIGR00730 family Rossman fold protein [Armatimonadota bacterium]|nr:TIGR00730 family Rossman fold protein [Armatimonadota bacterium]MDR7536765.1 TIGR00730 family Rossman fold protein [Armatimonadota bacterium]
MKRVTVFCGSNHGARPDYLDAARRLGRALVERGLTLVYGGSNVGLMRELAHTVRAAGGEVVGIIPRLLVERELSFPDLTQVHMVASMHERKALMMQLGDAFMALPGGFGTLEELFEVVAWATLGLHHKPVGLLNTAGYYDPLVQFIDHAVAERFVRPEYRQVILIEATPEKLLERLNGVWQLR